MVPCEVFFIQTLGRVLADDIYIYIWAHDALPLEIKILELGLFQSVQTFPCKNPVGLAKRSGAWSQSACTWLD